jgi:hypothetical protein
MNLDAKVNISDEVVASVTIKTWSKLDSLWIDQALVSYKPHQAPMEFLFGQQTFNYGLLTTRMISFPSIYDSVDLRKPGLVLNGTMDAFTGGMGIMVLPFAEYSPVTTSTDTSYVYSSVVNLDLALPNESIIRLSSFINKRTIKLDLAGEVYVSKFAFDFEGLATVKTSDADTIRTSGFYAGAQMQVTGRFALAVRGDGLSLDNFSTIDERVALGATFTIKDGIYCAVEVAHLMPAVGDASNELAIEFGLEQKIKLPGFQRKTLKKM